MTTRKRAFTLIETLVVIAIIGLLASILFAQITRTRYRARDTRRITDLTAIRDSLERYHAATDTYPLAGGCSGYGQNCFVYSYNENEWNQLGAQLQPFGLGIMPVDPVSNGIDPWQHNGLSYTYGNIGLQLREYDLTGHLEDLGHPQNCAAYDYRFYYTDAPWCQTHGGTGSDQIFEASR